MLLLLGYIAAQFIVIFNDASRRYCEVDLYSYALANTVSGSVLLGFTWVLSTMDPLPGRVKVAFHIWGLLMAAFNAMLFRAVLRTPDICQQQISQLYSMLYALSAFGVVTTGLTALMLPFWLSNAVKPGSMLDVRKRDGCCYEPVACLPCIWHV